MVNIIHMSAIAVLAKLGACIVLQNAMYYLPRAVYCLFCTLYACNLLYPPVVCLRRASQRVVKAGLFHSMLSNAILLKTTNPLYGEIRLEATEVIWTKLAMFDYVIERKRRPNPNGSI